MSSKKRRNKETGEISRREFLAGAGMVIGGAALGSTAFLSACDSIKSLFPTTTAGQTYFPANASINITVPPKTVTSSQTIQPAKVIPGIVSPALLALSLWTSNSPTKPADPSSGYAIKDRVFIDWNPGAQTRWFQWNLAINKPTKVLWQVTMMPFDNSAKTLLNPPGLVASGTIPGTQTEFSINTSKFMPLASAVKNNFSGPVFYPIAQQNVSKGSISRVKTALPSTNLVTTFNSALASQIANIGAQYAREKSVLTGYGTSLPGLSTGQPAINDKAVIISDPVMAATKAVLEATIRVTMRTYYIRVIALDGSDKPFGAPSNSIQILYGDPVFEPGFTLLTDMVLVQAYPTGDFQYQAAILLDWNGTAANLNKRYVAPLADTKDYAYSYFQVTQEPPEPDKTYALYPDGLVATVLSQQILTDVKGNNPWAATNIDFSTFAPKADLKNPSQTRYYVRAVHVYSDYAHIGFARLAFSPPMVVNYGDPKASKIDDSMIIPIDIGTPSIRFSAYTPPFFGDNPGNHAIVTKTPVFTLLGGSTIAIGPFSSLKPGDKVVISELEAWLEDKKRDEGSDILTSLVHAFSVLFTGIADLATSIGDAWTQIQAYAVSTLASIGIPPAIGGLLINAALMAAGIPPTLPNFDTLSNMGTDYISKMIVDQSGGLVPKELANAAADELIKQAKTAAATTVSGLPDDLSSLNGCLKPDYDYVWKPATISIELYNPLATQIPSGSFTVRLVDSNEYKVTPDTKDYFRPQTINYPPMIANQKINLTIPLEENCDYAVGGGVKAFAEDYGGGVEDSTWNKLIMGHKQLEAVIENEQPNIPSPPDFEKELGTHALLVHFNIINTVLNIKQDMANIKTGWNAPDDRFPSAIFVSPSGSDSANGSLYHPVKTLAHAISVAKANDSIVMNPGTYQADSLNITQPYLTIAGLGTGAIVKTSSNTEYAFKASQAATEFSIRGVEIDGGIYINGPDGVVLDSLKVINPKSTGIQLVNCSQPSITNCEIGKNGTTGNISNGVILDGCYNYAVSNCYIHDIQGNGVQILSFFSALGVVKNSTITKCQFGVQMGGSGNKVDNCFIHDTYLAGVSFVNSSNCAITRCTLYNVASDRDYSDASMFFDINPAGASSVSMEDVPNYGPFPKTFYAENNIFSEIDNDYILMVNASDDLKLLGIVKDQDAYVQKNIYHSGKGPIKYADLRKGARYQFTNTGKLPNGVTSFNWAGVTLDRNSLELDPQLDSQGRSIVPNCLGMGIQ